MRAIILAAGRGSRLHPYTAECPKCLTELSGSPLIECQLAALRLCGIEDIVIVTGFMAEKLSLPGTRQVWNEHWADTNMVESMFCALSDLQNGAIVSYSDIVYEPRILRALIDSRHDVSVAVDLEWQKLWKFRFDDPLEDAESLKLNDDQEIEDIGNRPETVEEIDAQFMGLMKFSKGGVEALASARDGWRHVERKWMADRPLRKAYMTDLLMELILRGETVNAVPVESGWIEIDTVTDYQRLQALAEEGNIARFIDLEGLQGFSDE